GLTHPTLFKAYQVVQQTIRNVAREKRVRLIDADRELSGRPDIFYDHVHLLENGSRQLAQMVADSLADILAARGMGNAPGSGN
ncbi:MAG: hypothetical protein IIA62_10110, partial [Nitrospinae bacterium]|nr:hypothetical protein [Nitrospinota bacterium]